MHQSMEAAIERIVSARRQIDCRRATLVAISGIDASGQQNCIVTPSEWRASIDGIENLLDLSRSQIFWQR